MEFRLPELGEGVYEVELVQWLVEPGQTVKHGQLLAEVIGDKASMELPAPFSGTIESLLAESGDQVEIGQVLLHYNDPNQPQNESSGSGAISTSGASATNTAAQVDKSTNMQTIVAGNQARTGTNQDHVQAAPAVRQMASQLGVDLNTVQGSGEGGRILLQDLPQPAPVEVKTKSKTPIPKLQNRSGERVKFGGIRRMIAEQMVTSKNTIPHYSYVDECDVTELVKMRASLKPQMTEANIKLTYLPFFVKAVVAALKQIPIVNASLEESASEIILHDKYNIGIAVSTDHGLMVPVIHNADQKTLPEIAKEIDRLSQEARTGKAKREDLMGGTFTITSIGGIGGLVSTPIINHPEVGILGIGKIVKKPVYDAYENIRPAQLVYLSLSFDHRVVDGAIGAEFTNIIVQHLQNPGVMLI